MTTNDPGAIRSLALIGGSGSGKTSFTEALLAKMGAIPRAGTIADGTTVSDHEHEEKERQHSISLGVLHGDHKGTRFYLLDAPGYPDFVGEAAAALAACETAVMFVNASEGVTFTGRRAWDLAAKQSRGRAVVVTHVDQAEIDWGTFCEELSESLGVRCLPVMMPKGTGEKFSGVEAVPFGGKAEGELATLRDAVIEAAVEVDEEVMTAFLEDKFVATADSISVLMRMSIVEGSLVPVLVANALDGTGADEFLKFAERCFPSPLHGPAFVDTDGNAVEADGEGTTAFVFKTIMDPFVGKLCLLRVIRGTLKSGDELKLMRTGKHERLAHFESMQGKDHKAVDTAVAGDLVAVAKHDNLETSDTLCDPAHEVTMRPLVLPSSPVARAIEPLDHADEVKLATALRRCHAEDPTFTFAREEATGELVVHGVTLMHVETVLRRIKERTKVEVKVEIPHVSLEESITIPAEGHHRHKKQTGGRGQFAEVYLKVEPGERGTGLTFLNETVGGSIPRNFIPAIEKGIVAAMAEGVIAGHVVVDIVVKVHDGKFHNVDSDEASFKKAGAMAFKDAFQKAKPVLLEPVMDMEIAVPSRFMGNITSDLTSRRGHIIGMDTLGDVQVVKANAPQREILTYPTALHAMTQGEGSFTCAFHDYEIVPANIQKEIMAEFKPKDDDD